MQHFMSILLYITFISETGKDKCIFNVIHALKIIAKNKTTNLTNEAVMET